MSVRVDADGVHLEGRCMVEDAEPLLLALQDHPGARVTVARATRLHMAVVQVLLAARAPLAGLPEGMTAARFCLAGFI